MDGVVDHRSSPSETATPTKQHPRSGARPSEALNSMSSPLWLHRVSGRSFHICWRYAIRQRTPQQAGRITSYGPGQPPTGDRTLWPEQVQDSNPRTRASVLSLLEERGYINSIAGERDTLDNLLTNKRVGAYVGVDPTAPSLHVGHLLPFMALFWLYIHGHHTVSLVGGATARIGDPTGRTAAREVQTSSTRRANTESILHQLRKLWANVERSAQKHGHASSLWGRCEVVNNNEWLAGLGIMEFLQVMGAGARLGAMLGRDTVKNKMETGDGMSFAEFTYPLLQSWDWWHMYQQKAIQVQIGGSDQFGNIVAGIDAANYILKNHPDPEIRREKTPANALPVGFTVPLLTTASGEKFGKSAGNAIWLEPKITSSFDLYRFFLRSADADLERHLKLFTFVPTAAITEIVSQHMQDPSKRAGQNILAREFLELVHGKDSAEEAENQHRILFRSRSSSTSDDGTIINTETGYSGQSTHTASNSLLVDMLLPRSRIFKQTISRALHVAGLVDSNSAGHRLVASQGAYVGRLRTRASSEQNFDDIEFVPAKAKDLAEDFLIGDLLVLRAGKTKVKVCKVVNDEKFERRGDGTPGSKANGRLNHAMSNETSGSVLSSQQQAPSPNDSVSQD